MPSEYPEKQLQWTCPSGIQKQFSVSRRSGWEVESLCETILIWVNKWYWDRTHDMPAMVGYLNHWATAALMCCGSVGVILVCDWSGGVFVGGADSFGE
ncbi:hypothetical protein TNCV_4811051 [Trichonephila clavipes]|nr:hypothetical protein TNCV_4811051 [Trichonephila clavipes]